MTKSPSLLLAVGALLALTYSATAAVSAPGVVGLDFHKARVRAEEAHPLSRRQSKTVQSAISNELLLYFINITAGTPGQPFSLQLDTGSSDIWFPDSQAPVCASTRQNECVFGAYNAQESSTFQNLEQTFQIAYVDGTQIEGEYISDVLNIGSTKLTNMTMAAATAVQRPIGIMGVGYQAGESIAGQGGPTYPNVINVLKNEGFINTLAYSLWLNDLDSNTGSILFGGVDSAKFHGDLVALPVQIDSESDSLSSFTVAWTGLSVSSAGHVYSKNPGSSQPAILDSGTTLTYFPDDLADQIFNGFGVYTDVNYGQVVHCSLADDDAVLSFTFGGPGGAVVNVSISEFVTPLLTTDGSAPTFQDGSAACQFGIDAAGQNPILFGDTFLRSAYVVYDLEDNLIGLGQTNFNATSSNIQAFGAGASSIPGVRTTASAVTVTQTFTGYLLPSASGTAQASGGVSGTSRSATFSLSAKTGSGGASSTGSSSGSGSTSAASTVGIDRSTVLGAITAVAAFFLGGTLIVLM